MGPPPHPSWAEFQVWLRDAGPLAGVSAPHSPPLSGRAALRVRPQAPGGGRASPACLQGPSHGLHACACCAMTRAPCLRRKSKAKPNGKKPAAEEKKVYLEPEYAKSRITDCEFKELVVLPREIDLNEWLASNSAWAGRAGAPGPRGSPEHCDQLEAEAGGRPYSGLRTWCGS